MFLSKVSKIFWIKVHTNVLSYTNSSFSVHSPWAMLFKDSPKWKFFGALAYFFQIVLRKYILLFSVVESHFLSTSRNIFFVHIFLSWKFYLIAIYKYERKKIQRQSKCRFGVIDSTKIPTKRGSLLGNEELDLGGDSPYLR